MRAPAIAKARAGIFASLLISTAVQAVVPQKVPFQGRVLVAGVPFQGTGQFKFALVNTDGSQTFWINSEDTSPVDGIPDTAVNIEVTKGLYSVLLGDTTLPNMAGNLSPGVLSTGDVRLRVWFNDGVRGFQQLTPDQPLGSVPYALVAATVADNPVFMGNVGIGIEVPSAPLDVAGRINAGSISLGGNPALDMPGSANVFVGNAGNASTTTFNSTGLGWGVFNSLETGFNNTAIGAYSLSAATTGGLNTALGVASLYANTEGTGNTAVGHDALHDNTTGSGNIALGWDAGRNLTTGNDNIAIGHWGVAGESGTIRIGTAGLHHTTHLAGTVKAERFEGDGSGLTQVPGTMQEKTEVVAWGLNGNGQATVPEGLAGVQEIAAGGYHTVALKVDGTVVAWGLNDKGQTTVPEGLADVVRISAGEKHTIALKRDGTMTAWGDNSHGECDVPPGLIGVVAIAAGWYHTVALKQDGLVVAWGGTGVGTDYGQAIVPTELSEVSAIAAGGFHTLALKQNGTIAVWGRDNGGFNSYIPNIVGVSAIAAGGRYSFFFVPADGNVYQYGAIPGTEFGFSGYYSDLHEPLQMAAGGDHWVFARSDGTLDSWGANDSGQSTPPSGLKDVRVVAAGQYHTVALQPVLVIPRSVNVSGTVSAQAFLNTSDREAKQRFTPVDPEAVLAKVAQLPLSEWSFQSAPHTRHLGPMAQDFRAAFGLGPDDRHIATVDADGVAFAAIQALYSRLRALEKELTTKSQLLDTLIESQQRLLERSGRQPFIRPSISLLDPIPSTHMP